MHILFFLQWLMSSSAPVLPIATHYSLAYLNPFYSRSKSACLVSHTLSLPYDRTFTLVSLTARIQFDILILIYKAFLDQAPCYLCNPIKQPISATSGRPLCSLDDQDLLIPRSKICTALQRAFASSLLWNDIFLL